MMQGGQLELELDGGNGEGVVIRCAGDLDIASADRLTEALEKVLAGGAHAVVVDGSRLQFVDSAGLRALLIGRKRAEQDGRSFRVVQPSEALEKMLEISGLLVLME